MSDKREPTLQYNARIPVRLHEWLKEKARAEDRSMNWMLVNILEGLKKSEEASHGSNSAAA